MRHCDDATVIGVDTEFISFPHYRNQLQLLQVSTPTILAVVDAQNVSADDMRPLLHNLYTKEVIFHSAEQDFVILYDLAARWHPSRFSRSQHWRAQVGN